MADSKSLDDYLSATAPVRIVLLRCICLVASPKLFASLGATRSISALGLAMGRWKSLTFIVAIAATASCAMASAADLPRKAPTYHAPAAIAREWSGFYLGINAGYGWQDPTVTFSTDATSPVLAGTLGPGAPISFNMSGPLGGVQAGYNWQFNQAWLLGLETDFDISDIKGSGTSTNITLPGLSLPYASTGDERIRWFGTLRGRLGYLPMNNVLVYVTGGLAYGEVEQNASYINNSLNTLVAVGGTCPSGPGTTCFAGHSTRVAFGWTVGGGFEYALWRHWSVKAEYLYVDLGSNEFNENVLSAGGTSFFTTDFSATRFSVARAGLNYRF